MHLEKKKLALLLSAAFTLLPAVSFRAATVEKRPAEESPQAASERSLLAVVISGKQRDSIEIFKTGSKLYLDAKRVGALYGGQVYWYPVSGRVQLSRLGRSLSLLAGSDKALAGDEELRLDDPVLVRVSRAFVPVSFLTGEGFSRWSGHETRYDESTRTLVIERKGTVGAPRAFSYKGRTRVSVELAPAASYRAVPRGTGGVDLVMDYGVAESDESSSLDDGTVSSYALKQEAAGARLSVRFAEDGQRWHVFELAAPRRAVVEVYAPELRRGSVIEPYREAAVPVSHAVGKRPSGRRLVVIDPGHGGKDPGATGRRGTREKDVNLAAALELARVLRERGDFDVLLTRDDDTFVPLSERSELANTKEADLFVSLHCNAADNKRENGFEVYSISETASDPEAETLAAAENAVLALEGKNPQDEMAKMILLAMTKTEMINESAAFAALTAKRLAKHVDVAARGAKQASFYVLRGTHAPAILVEMAFVSHSKDEAKLASRRFRSTMAEGVASGIADYARRQEWL